MELVGTAIVYLMMAFVLIGAVCYVFDSEKGMGREFKEGIFALGPLFLPVAGIMASLPYISWFITNVIGHVWSVIGASEAMAATTFIATDMGGLQLAEAVAENPTDWTIATVTGFMAGATIVFTIPVGLTVLAQKEHKYLALGILSGIIMVPVGVFVTMGIVLIGDIPVRASVSTTAPSDTHLVDLSWSSILLNLLPVIVIMLAIALGLGFATRVMVRGFIGFGRGLSSLLVLILAVTIVEHVTGFFSTHLSWWDFQPIIATEDDPMRPLEVAGNVAIVLAGAFPMVYAIRKYLNRPLTAVGGWFGIRPEGTAGLLAAAANMIAAFHLVASMRAKEKVLVISFGVCGAFLIGDHLAFTANFQPNLIAPLMIGKIVAAVLSMVFAWFFTVPVAERLEAEERKLEQEAREEAAHEDAAELPERK